LSGTKKSFQQKFDSESVSKEIKTFSSELRSSRKVNSAKWNINEWPSIIRLSIKFHIGSKATQTKVLNKESRGSRARDEKVFRQQDENFRNNLKLSLPLPTPNDGRAIGIESEEEATKTLPRNVGL
jgi:hypothetical protein